MCLNEFSRHFRNALYGLFNVIGFYLNVIPQLILFWVILLSSLRNMKIEARSLHMPGCRITMFIRVGWATQWHWEIGMDIEKVAFHLFLSHKNLWDTYLLDMKANVMVMLLCKHTEERVKRGKNKWGFLLQQVQQGAQWASNFTIVINFFDDQFVLWTQF